MRRSKRELAKLVNEQKAELEQFKLQREAMRLSMIEKYINAKKNGRNKTTKTIVLDGWKAYLHGKYFKATQEQCSCNYRKNSFYLFIPLLLSSF